MKKKPVSPLEKRLDSLFAEALKKKIFSGAAAGLFFSGKGEELRMVRSYGTTRYDEKAEKIEKHTMFDLASLTKPLCTVLCVLSLLEEKKLALSTPLQEALKGYRIASHLQDITIEYLMSHSSGFIDYRPLYREFKPVCSTDSKKKIIRKILQEPLVYRPGEKCLYSDLGFMLLGEIVEQAAGRRLDVYFGKKISLPLNLDKKILFRPLGRTCFPEPVPGTAATEYCPWRHRMLQGEVHDEHSWLMGGVAGHAGLFGTAAGVLALAEHILAQWQGKESIPSYGNNLLQAALAKTCRGGTWSLGFDRPAEKGSSAGRYFSAKSAGHLGYTGTSFWIDPERSMIAVLLGNRVHPTRKNVQIREFRPLFHDTVAGYLCGQ